MDRGASFESVAATFNKLQFITKRERRLREEKKGEQLRTEGHYGEGAGDSEEEGNEGDGAKGGSVGERSGRRERISPGIRSSTGHTDRAGLPAHDAYAVASGRAVAVIPPQWPLPTVCIIFIIREYRARRGLVRVLVTFFFFAYPMQSTAT